MAKTRLNNMAREKLRTLASTLVATLAETAAREAAYDKAAKAILTEMTLKYPPKDMAVLAKYDVARKDTCMRLVISGDTNVFGFEFKDTDSAPRVPGVSGRYASSCKLHAVSPETYRLVEEFDAAQTKEQETRATTLRDYRALIAASVTFEDVVTIWPEAEQLRNEICVRENALSVVTADLADRIAADMQRRKQAA